MLVLAKSILAVTTQYGHSAHSGVTTAIPLALTYHSLFYLSSNSSTSPTFQLNLAMSSPQPRYTVINSYLVSPLPRPYSSLAVFMANHITDSQGLDAGEWKYELKKMDPRQLKHYQQQMQVFNTALSEQRAQFDEQIVKPITELPDYHNMLLAWAELGFEYDDSTGVFEAAGQQHRHIKEVLTHLVSTLTEKEIYNRLATLHPYVRYCTYLMHQRIHGEFWSRCGPRFRRQVHRLPLLYIRHPYELVLIDQCTNSVSPADTGVQQTRIEQTGTQTEDYRQVMYISQQQQLQYESRWNQLPVQKRVQYQSRANGLVRGFMLALDRVCAATGQRLPDVLRLMQKQYDTIHTR